MKRIRTIFIFVRVKRTAETTPLPRMTVWLTTVLHIDTKLKFRMYLTKRKIPPIWIPFLTETSLPMTAHFNLTTQNVQSTRTKLSIASLPQRKMFSQWKHSFFLYTYCVSKRVNLAWFHIISTAASRDEAQGGIVVMNWPTEDHTSQPNHKQNEVPPFNTHRREIRLFTNS